MSNKTIFLILLLSLIGNSNQIYSMGNVHEDDDADLANFLNPKKTAEDLKKTNPLIIQLNVKNQFANDCGGAQSCGYHALKNGMFIAQGVVDKFSKDKIENDLNSSKWISKFFGTNKSNWRKIIIDSRMKKTATQYIQDMIVKNIKEKARTLETPNIHDVLSTVAEDCSIEVCKENPGLDEYIISFESLLEKMFKKLSEKAIKAKENKYKEIYAKLNTEEKIENYLNVFDLNFLVSNDNQITVKNKKIGTCNPYLPGELLLSNEIEQIIESEKKDTQTIIGGYKFPIFCLDKIESEELEKFIKENKSKINPDDKLYKVLIFIVHINENHWVTCVYNQNNNIGKFILANSSGNTDIKDNVTIKKLISLLETNPQNPKPNNNNTENKNTNTKDTNNENFYKQKNEYSSGRYKKDFMCDLVDPKITFDDLILNNNEIKKLKLKLNLLKTQPNERQLADLILLYGPPGTGKTSTAEAVASYLKYKFLSISASSLINSYQASGAQSIIEIFNFLNSTNINVVLFLDEIDGVSNKDSQNRGNDESRNTVFELQSQLSKKKSNIVCVCATNNYDKLTSPIISRFKQKIKIGLPISSSKLKFFKDELQKITNLEKEEIERLAKNTGNYMENLCFRDLINIIDSAMLLVSSTNRKPEEINKNDILVATFSNQRINSIENAKKIIKYFTSGYQLDKVIIDSLSKECYNNDFTSSNIENFIDRVKEIQASKNKTSLDTFCLYVELYNEMLDKEKECLLVKITNKNQNPINASLGVDYKVLRSNVSAPIYIGKLNEISNVNWELHLIEEGQNVSKHISNGNHSRITIKDRRTPSLPGSTLRFFSILHFFDMIEADCPIKYAEQLTELFEKSSLYLIKEIIQKSNIIKNTQNNKKEIPFENILRTIEKLENRNEFIDPFNSVSKNNNSNCNIQ